MPSTRTDALLALAVLTAFPIITFAQTAPVPSAGPGLAPVTPGSAWAPPSTPTPPPTPATPPGAQGPTVEIAPVTQAFVGTVVGENVYIRSGPDAKYYELGQLARGDLVYVVGSSKGWYQILPPNGTFCLIAKELVEIDAAGNGTVKGDFVNVRAGTALYKERDPSAVLAILRKGTKLKVLGGGGPGDKFYMVAPTDKSFVYISPQFIKAAPGTEYKVPQLKLPNGVAGPTMTTVTAPGVPPTAQPGVAGATVELVQGGGGPPVTNGNNVAVGAAPSATQGTSVIAVGPVPKPAIEFDPNAAGRFTELNKRFEAELKKPLGQQDLEAILADYKALLATDNLPPSVKIGTESQIASVERFSTLQKLAKESAASDTTVAQQRQALQEQYAAAERAVAEYQKSGPFVAEGTLQNSSVVAGKYALINPASGRVVAYVNSAADIDIGSLVGKYIGVRGIVQKSDDLTVIQVKNATLLPAPNIPRITNAVGGR